MQFFKTKWSLIHLYIPQYTTNQIKSKGHYLMKTMKK